METTGAAPATTASWHTPILLDRRAPIPPRPPGRQKLSSCLICCLADPSLPLQKTYAAMDYASFVPRLRLLREPAMGMGFGRPHLVTASLRIGARRLPPGVIAVISVTDNSSFCSAVFPFPTCVASSSTSSARARPVVVAAWDVGTAPTTFFNTLAPVARAENVLLLPTPGPSSRRRRRGVVASAGATPSREPHSISAASKHIRAWVDLATFKTMLEVAVDEVRRLPRSVLSSSLASQH
jgi:hypothetical protein